MADKDTAKKLPPAFVICACNPGYSGVHPSRARFEQGVARTADEKIARTCHEVGLAVFDENDEGEAKALKAFLRNREKAADEKA